MLARVDILMVCVFILIMCMETIIVVHNIFCRATQITHPLTGAAVEDLDTATKDCNSSFKQKLPHWSSAKLMGQSNPGKVLLQLGCMFAAAVPMH